MMETKQQSFWFYFGYYPYGEGLPVLGQGT